MFASLSLTKMSCHRIASYFILPVVLGLVFVDAAHYHRASSNSQEDPRGSSSGASLVGEATNSLTENNDEYARVDRSKQVALRPAASIVDSFELVQANGLVILAVIQLVANSFHKKLERLLK